MTVTKKSPAGGFADKWFIGNVRVEKAEALKAVLKFGLKQQHERKSGKYLITEWK